MEHLANEGIRPPQAESKGEAVLIRGCQRGCGQLDACLNCIAGLRFAEAPRRPLQAARAYDRARVMQHGAAAEGMLNFPISDYPEELRKHREILSIPVDESSRGAPPRILKQTRRAGKTSRFRCVRDFGNDAPREERGTRQGWLGCETEKGGRTEVQAEHVDCHIPLARLVMVCQPWGLRFACSCSGVTWDKERGKWEARISDVEGESRRKRRLGRFDEEVEVVDPPPASSAGPPAPAEHQPQRGKRNSSKTSTADPGSPTWGWR